MEERQSAGEYSRQLTDRAVFSGPLLFAAETIKPRWHRPHWGFFLAMIDWKVLALVPANG